MESLPIIAAFYEQVDVFMLVVVRVLAFFIFLPIVSGLSIPMIVRLTTAVVVGAAIFSSGLVTVAVYTPTIPGFVMAALMEFMAGAAMGFVLFTYWTDGAQRAVVYSPDLFDRLLILVVTFAFAYGLGAKNVFSARWAYPISTAAFVYLVPPAIDLLRRYPDSFGYYFMYNLLLGLPFFLLHLAVPIIGIRIGLRLSKVPKN